MILQSLSQLYERLKDDSDYKIPKVGYSYQQISFIIVLEADGVLFEIQDARVRDQKNNLRNTEIQVLGEAKPSGSGLNPCFLWDNSTYILGKITSENKDKKDDFSKKRFEAFKDKHLALESEIDDTSYSTVCRFLEKWNLEKTNQYSILDELKTGFGVFKILGEKKYVHEMPQIKKWWHNQNTKIDTTNNIKAKQCLVSGKNGSITRLHPKIKGVTGGQSSGAPLISFNEHAYESYGNNNAQGANAPISEKVAMHYGSALNALLKHPKHRFRISDTTIVFWTEKSTIVEGLFTELFNPSIHKNNAIQDKNQRNQIEKLLNAIRTGGEFNDFQEEIKTNFYILGLSPNAARIAIRFFHKSTIYALLQKLHLHQQCLTIIEEYPEATKKHSIDPKFPPIWMILKETARDSKDIPPLLGGGLMRAILEGSRYPEGLFASIIRRIHADRRINYIRAAMLKATLTRNHNYTITKMLDLNQTEPAYLLGRLFATLEKTQEDALNNLNAGLRDKYYSSASATPMTVFPRILRLYSHHLAKIKSIPIKIYLEKIVEEILSKFAASDGFPAQLNLQEQGLFAIGYYHQRRDFFTKKENKTDLEPPKDTN